MLKRFLRICSMILVMVMLMNTLPLQSFAADYRASLSATTTEESLSAGQAAEDATIVGEITANRTAYTKEYLMSNGLHMAAVYPDAVHYEKDGRWEEIDNTLKADLSGSYTNTAGVWDVRFPQQLSDGQAITITKDGYTLSFSMAGQLSWPGNLEVASLSPVEETYAVHSANTATAQIQKVDLSQRKAGLQYEQILSEKLYSQLVYNNVYDNTSIRYDLDSNRVKESVILNRYSSTLRGYRYTLNTGGMIPVLSEGGHIDFYDADQKNIVMVMPAPFLLDANMVCNTDITVQLTGSGSTYTLTYILPQAWLADSERAWPVILDPVVQADTNAKNICDHTVAETKTLSYTWAMLDCGYSVGYGPTRFFIMYDNLPTLKSSDVIVGANIQLDRAVGSSTYEFVVEVHKVLGTWKSSTLTWANKPNFDPTVEDYVIATGDGWCSWDITDIVRGWYSGENTGMMFKATDAVEAAAVTKYKQFYSSDYGYTNRPILSIFFRNNNGLESYWDYTASSAGRAGTGYINNYTGNLVWIRSDMGFGGNRMPVSISHVYNANDAFVPDGETNDHDFGMGMGWRTNFNQRVYQWKTNTNYYVWEDSDGTDHYFFRESSGVYKDEDGLELTLKTTGSGTRKYSITDKYGNVSYFDTEGRLSSQVNNQATPSSITVTYTTTDGFLIDKITDGAGRVYDFTYSNGLLTKIAYLGSGSTELAYSTYTYTGSLLTRITDRDSEYCTYTYGTKNLLTGVTDIDGYQLSYAYNTVAEGQPSRVSQVSESHNNAEGGQLSIEYAHNQTTFTDANDNVQIMQFNNLGNTVSVQDGQGRAQYAQYYRNHQDDDTGKANQLSLSSKLQNTVTNLLADSSFENGTLWTYSGVLEDGASEPISICTDTYSGQKAMKVVTVTSATGTPFQLPSGQTYTFSAYVKTVDSTAKLTLSSSAQTASSLTVPAGSNWTRIQASVTNDTDQTVPVMPVLEKSEGGTVYMDCVQLEANPTASRYNLVQDGDFQNGLSSWTSTSFTAATATAAVPQLDANVLTVSGAPTSAYNASQTVTISGGEGDTFVVSGWAKGDSVPLPEADDGEDQRQFAVTAQFNYTDGDTSDSFIAQFNPDTNSEENWQYTAQVLVAEKAYSSITVKCVYDYNYNTACFDGIQLYKEAFGSSYTYDDDGNVVSVVDLQKKETTYEYDTSNDLTQILQDNKAKMTYAYDDHHNVTRATSEAGIVYEFTYDVYGNNTSVSIVNGENKVTSTATYSTDGNRLVSTTDALGKITTYSYNADTNVLEWVQYPNDTEATRTTYTYDTLYRLAQAQMDVDGNTQTNNSLTASYTYENDLLTQIQTGSTTYSFSYGNFALRSEIKVGSRELATYSYTEDGNNRLASLAYGNSDMVQYTYDDYGRVTQQVYEDGARVSYQYDSSGALATVTDSATGIKTSYYYDFTDRLMRYVESGSGYSHSVGYTYDLENNLTSLVETINGVDYTTGYTYDEDNRLASVIFGNSSKEYSYDGYGRSDQQVTKDGQTTVKTDTFTFTAPSSTTSSAQISGHSIVSSGVNKTYTYTYDDNGNILSISDGTNTVSYVYDKANQLIRENNQGGNYTHTWTYDDAGNILTRSEYAYTTGSLDGITPTDTVSYTYGDADWGDLLTAYDGQTFVYDGVGNPLTQCDSEGNTVRSFQWKHGRQLAAMTVGGQTWTYTYNADGLRTSKSNGTATYQYIYDGSKLTQMVCGSNTLYFSYDAAGTPLTVTYNGTTYYYVTNLQGDVIAILSQSGSLVASYAYDAWGNLLSTGGSLADALGTLNPLRYRGYVYDTETQLYYLQSRYYDPQIGRFLNADALVATGQGVLGNNMIAYCGNNPLVFLDTCGTCLHRWDFWNNCSACSRKTKEEKLCDYVIDLANTIKVISSVSDAFFDNIDVYGGIGLGLLGGIEVCDKVELSVGVSYDLLAIRYNDGEIKGCQRSYNGLSASFIFWNLEGTYEEAYRDLPFGDANLSWVGSSGNSITVFELGGYLMAGATLRVGFDLNSFLYRIDDIF